MICTKCRTDKPISEFHKHQGRASGYVAWCKCCCAKNMREQYEKKREVRIMQATERNRTNPNRPAISRTHIKKTVDELRDSYVRRQIFKTSNIPYKQIPQGLIDVTRELMKLKRAINGKL